MEVDSSESGSEGNIINSDERSNDHHLLQKVNKLENYLPFKEEVQQNRQAFLQNLKTNALKVAFEQGDRLNTWMLAFDHYLTAFGFAFTKDEHIVFVKICLQTLDSIDDNIPTSQNLLKLTSRLLAKTHLLSRKDLTIDWRLVYRLFEQTVYSPHRNAKTLSVGFSYEKELKKLLSNARAYFPVEATAEILAEWRQYLCIYTDKFNKAINVLSIFLPTLLYPEEHNQGHQMWFKELMDLWIGIPDNGKNHYLKSDFVSLFSRLAKDAKGFIDWDPYLPVIFERFMSLLHVDTYKRDNKSINAYMNWIVYSIFETSKTLDHLRQFFRLRSVNYYISKEKTDSQFTVVVNAGLKKFAVRKRTESYKKNWFNFALPAHNLNDHLVNEFATIMVTVVEKIGLKDFDLENYTRLCNISAPILSEKVIDKLDLAYEQICEPKRLTSALQLFSVSLFPILTNDLTASQYRSNVLPILTSLASNINTYDENVCFLQLFAIRSIVVLGLPLSDCSHLSDNADLDENAKQLLLDTQQLEEFAHDYLRCCFTIIESNNEDLFKMSKSNFTLSKLLHESFLHVLANSSPATTKAVLDKLFNYANRQIIENEKACDILSTLIDVAFIYSSKYSMEKFFNVVVENTLVTIGNKTNLQDICKSELMYNLELLRSCFLVRDGNVLLAQEANIFKVLETIMKIEFEDSFGKITNWNVLSILLGSLLEVHLVSRVFPIPKNDVKQLINWPKTYALKDMPFEWHVPNEAESSFAKRLIAKFIEPEVSRLDNWADMKLELSKAQLEKSLKIVNSFASLKCLPSFTGGDDSSPSYLPEYIYSTNTFVGSTIRDDLMKLTGKVLKRLLTTNDASSSLSLVNMMIYLVAIPYTALSNISYRVNPFDYRKLYQALDNDTFIPAVQFSRLKSYHETMHNSLTAVREMKYTPGHKAAVEQLFILSTCPFESVHSLARWFLAKLLAVFPHSVELIVPQMMINLQKSEEKNVLEGSLQVLFGNVLDSLLFMPQCLQLWPQLLKSNLEKISPKIAQNMDYEKFSLISMAFVTIPINRSLLIKDFPTLFKKAQLANFSLLSSEEIDAVKKQNEQWNAKSQMHYNELTRQICLTLKEHKLSFRMQTLGTYFLNLLIRHNQLPPEHLVSYILNYAFVHDSIHIRRTAVLALKKILFLNRPSKEKVLVQYNASDFQVDAYGSEEVYNSTQFHDKLYAGYFEGAYTTKKIASKGPVANGFIAEKFKDKEYLDRLFELYSVENTTTIDLDFVKIWKYLYQTFELFNDELVFPLVEKQLSVDKHSHDKLAIEIIIALTNALPELNYSSALKVVHFIDSIIKKYVIGKFNSESTKLWTTYVSKIFNNHDIRRNKFLLDQLFNSAFHSNFSPFYQASFLHFLTIGFSYNFKYPQINREILSKLEDNLSHPYQNVRIAIAGFLSLMFPDKLGVLGTVTSENSRLAFVQRIVDKFEKAMLPLIADLDSSDSNMTTIKSDIFNQDSLEGKQLLNLIETVTCWTTQSLKLCTLINPSDFLPLLPYFCFVQLTQSNNFQVQSDVKYAVKMMGKISYTEEQIEVVLQMLAKVAKNWNWHCRNQVSYFLQHFLYTNIFALSHNDRSLDALLNILSSLMEDEVVEVRESASITLSSLLIWNVLRGDKLNQLVELFKKKALKKVVKGEDLLVKHGGILGLCSMLLASPDDIPAHLPDILIFLTEHMSDPQPIPKSITTAFNSFKRFHLPNWVEYKRQFNSDQLNELNNIFISPSYYA